MNNNLLLRCITGTLLGIFAWYTFFHCPAYVFSLVLLGALIFILLFEMPRLYSYKKPLAFFATLLYPVAPFVMLMYLNQQYHTRKLVLLIFALSIANDVGAYFVGKFWGKHKLCPSISPKKTVEGFIGGWLITALVLALFFKQLLLQAIILGLLAACVATAGDLFESWLKRRAHIKDSGNLLPGHGGLLDRFDSILAVTVLIFLLRNICHKKILNICLSFT